MKMNKKLLTINGLVAAAALLLLINILSAAIFKSARVDLTENNLYTLSDGTRAMLGKLDKDITLRFYFSDKLAADLPALKNYAGRVRELLGTYEDLAGGHVKLVNVDPEPFSDEEDEAVGRGLQGVPVNNAGEQVYFGLVVEGPEGKNDTIRFFQPEKEQSLEYDISRIIFKMAQVGPRKVGVLSSLPLMGGGNPFNPGASQEWMIISQLRQTFEVKQIASDVAKIDDDIGVLLVVHPKELSDKTRFAIDQFVLNGGKAMVFVDPLAETDMPMGNPMQAMGMPRNSAMPDLFDAWGVEMVADKLAADMGTAMRVTARRGMRPTPVDYVLWLDAQGAKGYLNKGDFVTGQVKNITFATAGILRAKEGATTSASVLAHTSPKSMQVEAAKVQFGPDPFALLQDFVAQNETIPLAMRITGKVKSAFPKGAPDKAYDKPVLKESKEDVNIIVVADTDVLSDRMWVDVQNFFGQRIAMPRAGNANFLVNAVDNLLGSNDLINLRSRGEYARPFEKVIELQRDAERQFREKERQLQARLDETERKINELQASKQGEEKAVLSPEQEAEIERFRQEQVATRKQLRNVQHELNKHIEKLDGMLKFINIVLIPLLISLAALAMVVVRRRRLQRLAHP